jgi:hypothetical protein
MAAGLRRHGQQDMVGIAHGRCELSAESFAEEKDISIRSLNGPLAGEVTNHSRRRRGLALVLALVLGAALWLDARSAASTEERFDGFNVIAAPGHPFGSATAKMSLANAKRLGAHAVAVVPFFWQSAPTSPSLLRGNDMTDAELRSAIRDAHALGLAVLVKPHVWVPERWAGAVVMNSEEAWQDWFAHYRRELDRIARIAEEGKAEALAVGTELAGTTQRQEWNEVIAAARAAYSGRLLYVAHNIEEAEAIPFWDRLDAIAVTLYPPLGADDDRDGRRGAMGAVAERLDALAARTGKTIVVGEVGLRSAEGAAAKPWESAEERTSAPDPALQAAVISDWLSALDRPAISGVLIWRWFTSPNAGGLTDTDFTVQGKPAEHILKCAWTQKCEEDRAGAQSP